MSDPIADNYQELAEAVLEHVKAPAKAQVTDILAKASAEAMAEADAMAAQVARFAEAVGKTKVQFGLIGVAAGAAAGAVAAFAVAYRKAEVKYRKIADEEIDEMREHYQAKSLALEADKGKGDLEEIVKERGYSSPEPEHTAPPMAVQPPTTVVVPDEVLEDAPPPVDAVIRAEHRNVFQEAEVTHEWDWEFERRNRRPNKPYVVHTDERYEMEDYQDVSLTYYEADDVLCTDRDDIVDPVERDELIGEKNLYRFGHGSGDDAIVYIRNDRLEILYEVIKSPNSFAEEVHGIKHESYDRGNLRRMRMRERDEE